MKLWQVDALFDVLPLSWSCWKRLYELRENLYEPVKDGCALGVKAIPLIKTSLIFRSVSVPAMTNTSRMRPLHCALVTLMAFFPMS